MRRREPKLSLKISAKWANCSLRPCVKITRNNYLCPTVQLTNQTPEIHTQFIKNEKINLSSFTVSEHPLDICLILITGTL